MKTLRARRVVDIETMAFLSKNILIVQSKNSESMQLIKFTDKYTVQIGWMGLMFLFGGAYSMDTFILLQMLLIVCPVLSTTLYFNQVYCKVTLQVTGHEVKWFKYLNFAWMRDRE